MPIEPGDISIHMIDPTDGRSLQNWSFCDARVNCISIGRDESAGIHLADPYVSRIHVELIRDENGWILHARGRNGVFVDGRSVTEYRLSHGSRFRLASVGPMFRFDSEVVTEGGGQQTLSIDPAVMNLMTLNKVEVVQQADEVTQTDYFRQLQEKARLLRRQRTGS